MVSVSSSISTFLSSFLSLTHSLTCLSSCFLFLLFIAISLLPFLDTCLLLLFLSFFLIRPYSVVKCLFSCFLSRFLCIFVFFCSPVFLLLTCCLVLFPLLTCFLPAIYFFSLFPTFVFYLVLMYPCFLHPFTCFSASYLLFSVVSPPYLLLACHLFFFPYSLPSFTCCPASYLVSY